MNAKWLILRTGLDAITKESWRFYRPYENAEITKGFKKAMYKLYREICNIKTVESDYMIEVNEPEPGNIDVYADDCNGNDFSLHFIKWENVLGYEVSEYSITTVGIALNTEMIKCLYRQILKQQRYAHSVNTGGILLADILLPAMQIHGWLIIMLNADV